MVRTHAALSVEEVPIASLRLDPANPRHMDGRELDALRGSLDRYGFVEPVVARRADGTVVGGHQRVRAASALGWTSVPVIWVDLDAPQARVLGLALNRIRGDFDEGLLAQLIADLASREDVDLRLSGFGEDEVEDLLRSLRATEARDRPEVFDLDAALLGDVAGTKVGDLWLLGDHRLLCGDATLDANVARLLGPDRPALCVADPPYGVGYGDHGGQQRGTRRRRMANDALDPAAFDDFVRAWADVIVRSTDGAIYLFSACLHLATVTRIFTEVGGHLSDYIIWAKDRFVLGRADFQRSFEPALYGWRQGAKHHWAGDRAVSDVWHIDRPSASPLHPTMKPLELIERAITLSSRPGDHVFDPFLGSGTTIIASERTGRRCLAIELDPRFVMVAIRRWERFTGQTAVLAEATDAS